MTDRSDIMKQYFGTVSRRIAQWTTLFSTSWKHMITRTSFSARKKLSDSKLSSLFTIISHRLHKYFTVCHRVWIDVLCLGYRGSNFRLFRNRDTSQVYNVDILCSYYHQIHDKYS